jgi:four helix bundle protein
LEKITSYKELVAYQKAYQLVLEIYRLSGSFPKEELYGLTSQIRRAAVSVPSNIAEGTMRGSREYLQFLKVSLGSAAEVETQLSLCKDLGFCGIEAYEPVHDLTQEVLRLLRTYICSMTTNVNKDNKAK